MFESRRIASKAAHLHRAPRHHELPRRPASHLPRRRRAPSSASPAAPHERSDARSRPGSPRTRRASCWSPPTPPAKASTSSERTWSSTTTFPGTRTASSSASVVCTASARPRSATCGTSSPPRPARRRSTFAFSTRSSSSESPTRARSSTCLGEALSGAELRRLLIDAIRYGDDPEVRDRINHVIDGTVEQRIRDAIEHPPLAEETMAFADVERIRQEMQEASARRLQPHYIRAFFEAALTHLGGKLVEREPGRFQITNVPASIRQRDRQIGTGAPVLTRYERITFDKELIRQVGAPPAELLAPGSPAAEGHNRPHPRTAPWAVHPGHRARRRRRPGRRAPRVGDARALHRRRPPDPQPTSHGGQPSVRVRRDPRAVTTPSLPATPPTSTTGRRTPTKPPMSCRSSNPSGSTPTSKPSGSTTPSASPCPNTWHVFASTPRLASTPPSAPSRNGSPERSTTGTIAPTSSS